MDFSFLKLSTSFNEAKSEIISDSQYLYYGGICLSPNEKYLQFSAALTDIAFDDSYKAELVDCAENVILDITSKLFINEFQDENGIYQIAFEIAPIKQDFYFETLYLRITHLDSDLVVYSNGFLVTDEFVNRSFRLDYKNYTIPEFYQSIRIIGYINAPSAKADKKVYTEINGKERKSRIIQTFSYDFNIDKIDTFTFLRLFNALNSNILYINGNGAETTSDAEVGDRMGKSNLFPVTFSSQLDFEDTYVNDYQIAPPFEINSLSPSGSYTFTSFPTFGIAVFNNEIVFGSGLLSLYNYDTDALVSEIPISVLGNLFIFSTLSLSDGAYYFLFNENLIIDIYGRTISITDKDIWNFTIGNADFLGADFLGTDFFAT